MYFLFLLDEVMEAPKVDSSFLCVSYDDEIYSFSDISLNSIVFVIYVCFLAKLNDHRLFCLVVVSGVASHS